MKLKFLLLLLALLSFLLVAPLFEDTTFDIYINLFFSSALMLAVLYEEGGRKKWKFYTTLSLFVPTFVLNIFTVIYPEVDLFVAFSLFFKIIFYSFETFILFRSVAKHRSNMTESILGSLCVYLLMGLAWSRLYELSNYLDPNSFLLSAEIGEKSFSYFTYFSFSTLTTLGYGDIVPISPLIRTFTYLETIMGVFFMATWMAILVTEYSSRDQIDE